jgi:hypothetical protein
MERIVNLHIEKLSEGFYLAIGENEHLCREGWYMGQETGKIQGDEIVQMYIKDIVSSVTRPVKELKGFARISLKPGETKKVVFEITPEKLAFHNLDMKYVVEPGVFEIMTGPSSRDEDLQKTILTAK